jgi:hypothetical protein
LGPIDNREVELERRATSGGRSLSDDPLVTAATPQAWAIYRWGTAGRPKAAEGLAEVEDLKVIGVEPANPFASRNSPVPCDPPSVNRRELDARVNALCGADMGGSAGCGQEIINFVDPTRLILIEKGASEAAPASAGVTPMAILKLVEAQAAMGAG